MIPVSNTNGLKEVLILKYGTRIQFITECWWLLVGSIDGKNFKIECHDGGFSCAVVPGAEEALNEFMHLFSDYTKSEPICYYDLVNKSQAVTTRVIEWNSINLESRMQKIAADCVSLGGCQVINFIRYPFLDEPQNNQESQPNKNEQAVLDFFSWMMTHLEPSPQSNGEEAMFNSEVLARIRAYFTDELKKFEISETTKTGEIIEASDLKIQKPESTIVLSSSQYLLEIRYYVGVSRSRIGTRVFFSIKNQQNPGTTVKICFGYEASGDPKIIYNDKLILSRNGKGRPAQILTSILRHFQTTLPIISWYGGPAAAISSDGQILVLKRNKPI